MKNFLILLIFLPITASAQSLPELIREYEKYCAEMVHDTIEVQGTIHYELVPVMDGGKIDHYTYGQADTTWSKPECPEFKEFSWLRQTVFRLEPEMVLYGGGLFQPEMPQKRITRKYYCLVKRREVDPFSEHFWEWVKSRGE